MTFTRRWFVAMAVAPAAMLLGLLSPVWVTVAMAYAGVVLALTLAEYFLLPSPGSIAVERVVDPQLSVGADAPVQLVVRSGLGQACTVTVRDEPPEGVPNDAQDATFRALPQTRHTVTYRLTPRARGDFAFGDLYVRVHGVLGLLNRHGVRPAPAKVRVYPNLVETAKFTLMARRGRLQQAGIRAARLAGAGREFESLRDYQPDDEYRRIDWKATARRGRLTSRQYEVERSQNVVLVLDVGRTMLAEVDGVAKTDYAVNAALLLAYVATLTDDKVGLLVFADTVQAWVAPRRGRQQVYRMLDALYNAHARRAEPDYRGAFAFLTSRWRRRSLMVCFTDLWDPDSSRQTIAELTSLQPRHLVACVTLMDTNVLRASESQVTGPRAMYSQAAALQVLEDRARATAELQRRGILVVDSPAEKLSAALVNRYLEVKERMLL